MNIDLNTMKKVMNKADLENIYFVTVFHAGHSMCPLNAKQETLASSWEGTWTCTIEQSEVLESKKCL